MKLSSQPPRTPLKLSDSVHHQLNMYALAASAAGVGMLALAARAEAEVVYTPVTIAIVPDQGPVGLDLNHDGLTDFKLSLRLWPHHTCTPGPMLGCPSFNPFVIYRAQPSNSVWSTGARRSSYPCAAAVPRGRVVGPHRPFQSRQLWLYGVQELSGRTFQYCPWQKGVQAYLGLKFMIAGQVHYGWARVQSNGLATAFVDGYAYETVANKPIVTGRTKGPDVITARPGSLGHLAAGASAIPAWRSGK